MLEATMAAAGLLDAWLTPDGELSTADGQVPVDVQLPVPDGSDGPTLATVLAPEPAGGVSDEVIRSVLAGIGWHRVRPVANGANAWLAADGTWRIGPLTGRAEPVRPASYLGAAAREAARQREIQQVAGRLTELAAEISGLDEELQDVDDQLSTLTAEAGRVPPERPVGHTSTVAPRQVARPAGDVIEIRLLGGLETGEVARAFLVPEATMSQRLVRAKRKIRHAGIPYRVPPAHLLPGRTAAVLGVLYLLFNEGYAASAGADLVRVSLTAEAIRLARVLVSLMPGEPEVEGLLALLLLHDARRAARISRAGSPGDTRASSSLATVRWCSPRPTADPIANSPRSIPP